MQPTVLPLTTAQQAIWLGHQLDQHSPAYNVASWIEIDGDLDPDLLARALHQAVQETDVLRVRITEPDGDTDQPPCQTILAEVATALPLIDLAARPDPDAAAQAWMAQDVAGRIDLAHGPLFASALLRLAPGRHAWYFKTHHICLDGFGLSMLFKRAAACYTALARGVAPAPAPFGRLQALVESDAAWQATPAAAASAAFWQRRCRNTGSVPSLAGKVAQPAHSTLHYRSRIAPACMQALESMAEQRGTHWVPVLVAAFAVFIARSTGQRDVVLGVPFLNRLGTTAADVPSSVANVLPLHVTVRPQDSAALLVSQVAADLGAMREHQRYRAEDVRRDCNLVGAERRLSGPQINIDFFSDVLSFQAARGQVRVVSAGPADDLSLLVQPDLAGGGLRLLGMANPSLYTEAQLARHVERFLAFLPAFLAHQDQPAGHLDACLPDELTSFFSDIARANDAQLPAAGTLVSRFEAQAAAAPEAIALRLDGASMTYAQLNAQSNQLARLLAERMDSAGAGAPLVALLLARSMTTVVAILGVLKAGAAYLPLDPDAPPGRIAGILAEAQPQLLLADGASAAAAADPSLPLLLVDAPATQQALAAHSAHDLGLALQPDDLAYIIYTSGSTGKPKGVCISHHNVARLFATTHSWFDYRASDVWTMCHSYIFDASVWEMWGALLHGARLVIVPVATTREPEQLLALLVAEKVTVSGQIPSSFYRFIEAEADNPELGRQLSLRYQCFGGEALDPARLLPWLERHPDDSPRLLNMYGITETTINTTYRFIRRADAEAACGSVIGSAFDDLGMMVLDDALRPVPEGGYGEMYISGAGLARGYLRRADLDATRFVANPYGPPGSRMYRSGDVAMLLPGGDLEYLGRADQQVKVRGYRIELGEIEAHLRAHPHISDAVASVRLDAGGDARLLAHVVALAGSVLDLAAIRDDLRARVPSYMVPNALGELAQLPLTPNGKVDRKALPDIAAMADSVVEPARDAIDEAVLACWCRHLQLERLGIDHNFFDVGGDSIKAIRVCRELDIPVLTLFDAPTARASADYLRERHDDTAAGVQLLHRFAGSAAPGRLNLVCVPFAGGNVFAFRSLVNALSDRFACISLNLPGHDVLRPDEAMWPIAELASRVADELVSSVQGPIVIYGHCAGNAIAVALARELEQRGADLRALVIGAMLPDADPAGVQQDVATRSGADIIAFLRGIGGFQDELDEASMDAISRMTKHDATETAGFFARDAQQARPLLSVPIHAVIGSADPLTSDYATRYRDWAAYTGARLADGTAAVSLSVIDDGGHYFVTDLPQALATVLERAYGALAQAGKARSVRALREFHNPFDEADATFYLLSNHTGNSSLWPAFAPRPAGWTVQYGPATHALCLARLGAGADAAIPQIAGLDAPYWPDQFAESYRAKGYWTDATLGGIIDAHALASPDRVALVDGARQLTYAELDQNANRLADGLAKLGLAAGERVVVQLPNSIRFVEMVFALFRLGAIPVFALPSDRVNEITHVLAASGASAYVIEDQAHGFDYRQIARDVRAVTPQLRHVIVAGEAQGFVAFDSLYGCPKPWARRDARAAALITLSGGSTALPKLIVRRHQDYLYSIRASADICALDADSVYLCVLPAGHNFTLSSPGFLGVLHAGGRVVMTSDPSGSNAFALIARERVTLTAVVPSLALAWLQAERAHDLSSLKVLQVGGARLSDDVAARLDQAFPGCLQQVYGMSEGLVCYTRLDDSPATVLHTQGLPISADDEIRIVDDNDEPVARGQEGELLVRGPYTIRGYLNAPEHNARAFTADGFYRTGDTVLQRADGYLVVVGRIKDQVNRGGEKIAAEAIEAILMAHPQVSEAAIVGLPDQYLGELACACVVLAPGAAITAATLKAFVRDSGVASHKVPDLVRFVPSLPKTTLGKIDKKELRKRLAQ